MTEFTPSTDAEAAVLRMAATMNAQDLEGFLASMTDDYVRYGEETDWGPMSKTAVRAFAENFWASFPDITWEILDMVSQGNKVVLHVIERGTLARPWEINGQMLEPTNVEYATHSAVFFTVRDNLVESYLFLHDNDFMAKFGHLLNSESVAASMPDEARAM